MNTREFKRVIVIGLEFYVDYLKETGEIICIKECHSGRRFITDNIFYGKEPVENLFKRAIGLSTEEKEVKKEVSNAKKTRKANTAK